MHVILQNNRHLLAISLLQNSVILELIGKNRFLAKNIGICGEFLPPPGLIQSDAVTDYTDYNYFFLIIIQYSRLNIASSNFTLPLRIATVCWQE